MTSLKEALIRDIATFLGQNFPNNHQFLVSSSYPKKVIQKTRQEAAKEPPSPATTTPSPLPTFVKKERKDPLPKTPLIPVEIPPSRIEKPSLAVENHAKILHRLFPNFALKETPPNDTLANAMTNTSFQGALQAKVLLMCSQEEPLLQNIQKAIAEHFVPTHLFSLSTCQKEEEFSFFLQNMQAKEREERELKEGRSCFVFVWQMR